MINLKTNYSLKKNNTFGLDIRAKYFTQINSEEDLFYILGDKHLSKQKILVLGGGANILFTKDFDGLIVLMRIRGLKVIAEEAGSIVIELGAGENWHRFVTWSVEHNYGGVENLALIPGTVGAAPVQNIAAYGQNFEDVFVSLDAINLINGHKKVFGKKECQFAYRDSFFKNGQCKDKWIITKVRIRLNKIHSVNTSYFETGNTFKEKDKVSIVSELKNLGRKYPFTIKDMYDAVVSIRSQKLPDFKKLGNAGSVFKNPVITKKKYNELLKLDPDLQCYPADSLAYIDDKEMSDKEGCVKIPAGRLLDNLGWKGKKFGNAGVYDKHALVVVNYGKASPEEILHIISLMKEDVYNHYGIILEPEIVIT